MTLDEAEAEMELERRFLQEATWEYRRSIWPRRCYKSRRWMWMDHHWRMTKTFGGIVGVFEEVRWLHREIGTHIKLTL